MALQKPTRGHRRDWRPPGGRTASGRFARGAGGNCAARYQETGQHPGADAAQSPADAKRRCGFLHAERADQTLFLHPAGPRRCKQQAAQALRAATAQTGPANYRWPRTGDIEDAGPARRAEYARRRRDAKRLAGSLAGAAQGPCPSPTSAATARCDVSRGLDLASLAGGQREASSSRCGLTVDAQCRMPRSESSARAESRAR